MNLRFQKPIFQYIEKKVTPHAVLGTDPTLNSKLTKASKCSEVKKLDIPPLPYVQIQQKQNISEPQRERNSTEIFKGRQFHRKQSVDTLLLYDRIDKKSIAVNITYVSIIKNECDLERIQATLKKKNIETSKEGKQNSMKQMIKEEQQNQKTRVSMSTKIKLGNLTFDQVIASQGIRL